MYYFDQFRACALWRSCLERRLRVVLHRKLSSFSSRLAPQFRQQCETEVDSSSYPSTCKAVAIRNDASMDGLGPVAASAS
jgi:hypothetical protein